MNEALHLDSTLPGNSAHCILKIEFNFVHLIDSGDGELERSSGKFGGSSVAVIGHISHFLGSPIVTVQCSFDNPGVPEFGTVEFLDLAQVPQIRTVQ
jgi:hypothetical protein